MTKRADKENRLFYRGQSNADRVGLVFTAILLTGGFILAYLPLAVYWYFRPIHGNLNRKERAYHAITWAKDIHF